MEQLPIDKWTVEQCEEYLKKYPKSLNSDAVRKRYNLLLRLQNKENESPKEPVNAHEEHVERQEESDEESFWAEYQHTAGEIDMYLEKYPRGVHYQECDDLLWELRMNCDDIGVYMKHFPQGKHRQECEDAYWSLMIGMGTPLPGAIQEYLRLFPNGKHVNECSSLMDKANDRAIDRSRRRRRKENVPKMVFCIIGLGLCTFAMLIVIVIAIIVKEWTVALACIPIGGLGAKLVEILERLN